MLQKDVSRVRNPRHSLQIQPIACLKRKMSSLVHIYMFINNVLHYLL